MPGAWWPPAGSDAAETIWIHAASVGEVRAAAPLVARVAPAAPGGPYSRLDLHGERPADRRADARGRRRLACALPVAADRLGADPGAGDSPGAPGAVYPPRDRTLAGAADGTAARPGAGADRQRPDLAAQLRTLSDGAPAHYTVLEAITLALARTADDAERYRAIGLPASRVRVAGNLKHARRQGGDLAGERRQAAIRERLGTAGPGARCWSRAACAAPRATSFSRHFADCAGVEPALLLVLAPRHPERFNAGKAPAWRRLGALGEAPRHIDPGTAVVVLDTLGELADFYAAADVASSAAPGAITAGTICSSRRITACRWSSGRTCVMSRTKARRCWLQAAGFWLAGPRRSSSAVGGCSAIARARDAAGNRALEVAMTFSGAVETVARAANPGLPDILDGRRGARRDRRVRRRLERIWYPNAGSGRPRRRRCGLARRCLRWRPGARRGPSTGACSRRDHLPVPCVSVGNLSVGGTGKTPLVAWLIDELTALGARPRRRLPRLRRQRARPRARHLRRRQRGGPAVRRRACAACRSLPGCSGRRRPGPPRRGSVCSGLPGEQRSSSPTTLSSTGVSRRTWISWCSMPRGGWATAMSCLPVRCASRRRPWPGRPRRAQPGWCGCRPRGVAADGHEARPPGGARGGRSRLCRLAGRPHRRAGGTSRRRRRLCLQRHRQPRLVPPDARGARDEHPGRGGLRDHHAYGAGEIARLQRAAAASGAAAAVTTAKDAVRIRTGAGRCRSIGRR